MFAAEEERCAFFEEIARKEDEELGRFARNELKGDVDWDDGDGY